MKLRQNGQIWLKSQQDDGTWNRKQSRLLRRSSGGRGWLPSSTVTRPS